MKFENKRHKCALLSQKYERIKCRFYLLLSLLTYSNKSKILQREILYLLPLKTTTWVTFMPVLKHLHFQGRSLGSVTYQWTWTFISKGQTENNDWVNFLNISGLLPAPCVLCKITEGILVNMRLFVPGHILPISFWEWSTASHQKAAQEQGKLKVVLQCLILPVICFSRTFAARSNISLFICI